MKRKGQKTENMGGEALAGADGVFRKDRQQLGRSLSSHTGPCLERVDGT